jgi:hypothetical protein
MSDTLNERLNKILPTVTSDDFLSGSGIGNEVAFYIFDYPPEEELRVRDFLRVLLNHIPRQKPGLRVKHVNLFDLLLDYLRSRRLLEKVIQTGRKKGDEFLKNELLKGPLTPDKLAAYFVSVAPPRDSDLVIVSGVGSAYPLVRTHALLSIMQSLMDRTPLVMFYPGKYDQLTFRLFGKLALSTSIETESKGHSKNDFQELVELGG